MITFAKSADTFTTDEPRSELLGEPETFYRRDVDLEDWAAIRPQQFGRLGTGDSLGENEKGESFRTKKHRNGSAAQRISKVVVPATDIATTTDDRVRVAREVISILDSAAEHQRTLQFGTDLEKLRRTLALCYDAFGNAPDSASFVAIVSDVERALRGIEIQRIDANVIQTLRSIFQACYEKPHIENEVLSARAALNTLHPSSIALLELGDDLDADNMEQTENGETDES